MERFYVVLKGNPRIEEEMVRIAAEASEAGEESARLVIDLKDKVEVLGCFLDRGDAEDVARDKAQTFPEQPIFVLHPYCMFEAEERPVNRTTIY